MPTSEQHLLINMVEKDSSLGARELECELEELMEEADPANCFPRHL